MRHPNEELLRRESEAWESGDPEAVIALYTEDAVYHYPGNNPLAGDYHGHDGIREFLRKRADLLGAADSAGGHFHDFVANDEHGVQLIHVIAAKRGREVEWRGVVVYHFRDGKLDHAWVHVDPQRVVDEFLNSLRTPQ